MDGVSVAEDARHDVSLIVTCFPSTIASSDCSFNTSFESVLERLLLLQLRRRPTESKDTISSLPKRTKA